MICSKCGSQIPDSIGFCSICGEPVNNINNSVNDEINLNDYSNQYIEQPVNDYSNQYTEQSINDYSNKYTEQPINDYSNQYIEQPINDYGNQYAEQPMNDYNNQVDQQFDSFNQSLSAIDDKKNNGLVLVIAGIVVALIICGAIIAKSTIKNSKNNEKSNSNETSTINSDSNSNADSNSNVTSNSNTSNTTTSNSNVTQQSNSNTTPQVTNGTVFKGYVFQLPSTYKVSANSTQLQLIGTNNIDIAIINIVDGSFDSLKSSNAAIKTYMENAGFKVGNIQMKTISGVEFIYAPVVLNDKNMVLSYAKLSANKIFMLVNANTTNTFDYNPIITFAPVVAAAKTA